MSPHRDLVHRQTASAVVQHMSLGVYGFGCEDSLNHLLNYVWPNVFETSPHVIQAVMGALEGLRVAIGPCRMLQYCLQVRHTSCFHIRMNMSHLMWWNCGNTQTQTDVTSLCPSHLDTNILISTSKHQRGCFNHCLVYLPLGANLMKTSDNGFKSFK